MALSLRLFDFLVEASRFDRDAALPWCRAFKYGAHCYPAGMFSSDLSLFPG